MRCLNNIVFRGVLLNGLQECMRCLINIELHGRKLSCKFNMACNDIVCTSYLLANTITPCKLYYARTSYFVASHQQAPCNAIVIARHTFLQAIQQNSMNNIAPHTLHGRYYIIAPHTLLASHSKYEVLESSIYFLESHCMELYYCVEWNLQESTFLQAIQHISMQCLNNICIAWSSC